MPATEQWKLTNEHRAQIPAWNARWIELIRSTAPIDFEKTSAAVRGMYVAAGLPVEELRIVHVLSPMMGVVVTAFAAEYWRIVLTTRLTTYDATADATRNATYDATADATNMQTMLDAADAVVTQRLGYSVRAVAVAAMANWQDFYNGGSEWAAWCSYLSCVRDVVGWQHPSHVNYAHYEFAAIHGGPRFLHPQFAILSERARSRLLDEDGQLHDETAPAISWYCGTAGWYLHGIQVDEQIVMRPETQTLEQIDGEENADVRAIRIARFGWPRYLQVSGAERLHASFNAVSNTPEALYRTNAGELQLVAGCPTGRLFAMPIGDPAVQTCQQAQNWLAGHPIDSPSRVISRT